MLRTHPFTHFIPVQSHLINDYDGIFQDLFKVAALTHARVQDLWISAQN